MIMKAFTLVIALFIIAHASEQVLYQKTGIFTENNCQDTLVIKIVGNDLNAKLAYKIKICDSTKLINLDACHDPNFSYSDLAECKREWASLIDDYYEKELKALVSYNMFSFQDPKNEGYVKISDSLWCYWLNYDYMKFDFEQRKVNRISLNQVIADIAKNPSRLVIPVWGPNEYIYDYVWSGILKDIIVVNSPYAP